MAAKKKTKRPSTRPRRTAIVPRVVFQTMVAMSVVPSGAVLAGCGQSFSVATTDASFDANLPDTGPDAGFSVVALPRDAGPDGAFGVADAGGDSGFFSVVARPPDSGTDAGRDTGFFSVVAIPLDGAFSVLVAPFDSGTSAS